MKQRWFASSKGDPQLIAVASLRRSQRAVFEQRERLLFRREVAVVSLKQHELRDLLGARML
jgi:hypothetical protein